MKLSVKIIICLFFFSELLLGQEKINISGIIKDNETGLPLSRVNVLILENKTGAITNGSGLFEISGLEKGKYTIQISLIGYQRIIQSIKIENSQLLNFQMKEIPLPGQTVIVTAMRGEERVAPVTFSNLEKVEIEKRYSTQDIPALLSELPSTTFFSESGNGIGYNYLNIRGFDQRRISVMINGVPQNDPEDHNIYWLDFPDLAANLENIQVQRGAGSAFYGPASIGGSINLITSNFSHQKGISAYMGAGNYNSARYSLSFSSGLIDSKYSFFAKLSKIKSDGYRDKSWADYNSFFMGAIRYDENVTSQIHVYGGPISDHLAYYGISKSDANDRDKRKQNPITRDEEIENFSQPHYEFLQEWRIGENLIFNHTLFFIEGEGFFNYDASWGDTSYFRMTGENGFQPNTNPENALVKAFVHNKQIGWLPRFSLNHEKGEFTFGLEFRKHRSLHWGKVDWAQNLPSGIPFEFHYYEYNGAKDIFAAYVHELYRMLPDMNLMLDLQYSYNKYGISNEKFVGTDFTVPYHFLNSRFGINYNFTKDLNSYFNLSYVSREPRLNNIYDAGAERDGATPQFELKIDGSYDYTKPLVKPENLFNVEVGLGYSSSSFHSTLNFYWMEFTNEIVKSGQLDRFGQPVTGNADKTRHIGLELTFDYRISGGLSFSGNLSASKNYLMEASTFLKKYDPDLGKKIQTEVFLDNNRIAGFPDLLSNLKLVYSQNDFYGAILFQYVGGQMTDNFGELAIRPVTENKVDSYSVINLYLSYNLQSIVSLKGIQLKLQVNNLFDKLYITHGESDEFFPAAERNAFIGIQVDL